MTTPEATVSGSIRDHDVAQLHALGYAQELRRRMGGFSNFAVSFTIISVLSGCLTLYYFGMTYGGPVDIVWGWVIVGVMTTIVGLGMAEDRVGVSDGRGSVLLVGQTLQEQSRCVELVHRMVQPAGPGRGHRRHRLRLCDLLHRVLEPDHGL